MDPISNNNSLKIAYVVKYYLPMERASGILRFVENLCRKLSQYVDLTVVTFNYSSTARVIEEYEGYTIMRVSSPFPFTAATAVRKLSPDIISFGSGFSSPALLIPYFLVFRSLVPEMRIILVQYTHMGPGDIRLTLFTKRLVDGVICLNPDMKRYFKQPSQLKVHYIPPGVDINYLDSVEAALRSSGIRIGFFGHFNRRKGADRLLKAFIESNLDDVELVMAGEGPLKRKMLKATRGIDNIHIYGYISAVESFIKSCDFLVFPYRTSTSILGFSQTAIEAMAMCKPIVVSDIPCLASLVDDKLSGFIFRSYDELVSYIKILSADGSTRQKMGIVAREKAEKYYDINKICERTLEVYRQYHT